MKKRANVSLTRSTLEPIIKDLKEFIVSTARGTENVLGGKIEKLDKRLTTVEVTVKGHSNAIIELSHNMKKMETRLNDKIDGVEKRLDGKIDNVRSELNNKIDGVRVELSSKMDKVIDKVDSHETRLIAVEEKLETHLTTHP